MAFESKAVAVRNNQLKVQEVNVTVLDDELVYLQTTGEDPDFVDEIDVQINEPVAAVHQAIHVASDGTLTAVAAADCTIITSTSGVLLGAIKLNDITLAAGDKLCVRYQLS